MEMQNPLASLTVVGGRTSLDFTNTLDSWEPAPTGDRLHAYDDLVWWGLRVGLLDEPAAERLFARARAGPAEAERVFARAMRFRAALYRVFAAAAAGAPAPGDALQAVNAEWALAAPHLRLSPSGGGFAWEWEEADALDSVLRPVAHDAVELLAGEELRRVGACGGETCNWLYLDTSRNRSRRWCEMETCGNRAKAKRHYHRTKAPSM